MNSTLRPSNNTRSRKYGCSTRKPPRLKVRILGIAPMVSRINDDGSVRASIPLFWLYYPDLRPVLAKYDVYNQNNDAATMTWEDLFRNALLYQLRSEGKERVQRRDISIYIKDGVCASWKGRPLKTRSLIKNRISGNINSDKVQILRTIMKSCLPYGRQLFYILGLMQELRAAVHALVPLPDDVWEAMAACWHPWSSSGKRGDYRRGRHGTLPYFVTGWPAEGLQPV